MSYQFIREEIKGTVHILTINRPEVTNKLNIGCMDELVQALQEAERDEDCRSVILTGAGEYFCNGGELGDFRTQSSPEILEFGRSFIDLHTTITGLSRPVIAAVQGPALGGGFNLVEACDLGVASEDAVFGVPEIKAGLAPMMALTGLSRTMTRKGVMELSLFGDPVTARRAVEIGLINSTCSRAVVLEEALKMADKLADASPTAVSLCKKLYEQSDMLKYKEKLEAGLNILVSLLKSEDAAEALTAGEENRQPVWRSR